MHTPQHTPRAFYGGLLAVCTRMVPHACAKGGVSETPVRDLPVLASSLFQSSNFSWGFDNLAPIGEAPIGHISWGFDNLGPNWVATGAFLVEKAGAPVWQLHEPLLWPLQQSVFCITSKPSHVP